MLDAYKEKLEFPDLKRAAYDKYQEFEPDQMIVEKKASGAPLIFELRAMGIPVTEFTPSRGQDPSGDHDDLVDSTTQALLRFRQGGWVRAESDDWDDEPKYRRPVEYY